MSFNPDPSKQAREVFLAERLLRPLIHKYASTKLLIFDMHIKTIVAKVNETIGLLRLFQWVLLRSSLAVIYKSFVRLHLDFGDIFFDQTFRNSFHQRMKSIQYDAVLAIMWAIRGTLRKPGYQEQGFESLKAWRNIRFFTK